MGEILPGLSRESAEEYGFSGSQFVIYAIEHYILIGLYSFLLVLALVNIWTILIKQGRYKTLPLLFFYIFAFLSIFLRLILIIMAWSKFTSFGYYINDFYLVTKLSVGLIQSWMIFEIALRVRQTYISTNGTGEPAASSIESFEKRLRCGQYSTIALSVTIAFAILLADTVLWPRDDELTTVYYYGFAFSYLSMFFLFAAVNILLLCVMRERKKLALRSSYDQTYSFRRESCTLKITLFFFEVSYLSRFLWDIWIVEYLTELSFAYGFCYDMSLYIDVLPFIGLLLFHYKNFRQTNYMPTEEHTDELQHCHSSLNQSEEVLFVVEPNFTLKDESSKLSLVSSASRQELIGNRNPLAQSSSQGSLDNNTLCQSMLGPTLAVYEARVGAKSQQTLTRRDM